MKVILILTSVFLALIIKIHVAYMNEIDNLEQSALLLSEIVYARGCTEAGGGFHECVEKSRNGDVRDIFEGVK